MRILSTLPPRLSISKRHGTHPAIRLDRTWACATLPVARPNECPSGRWHAWPSIRTVSRHGNACPRARGAPRSRRSVSCSSRHSGRGGRSRPHAARAGGNRLRIHGTPASDRDSLSNLGRDDAESAFPPRTRPPDDNLDISTQGRQKSQQSFNRVVPKVSPEQARNVRLRQPELLRRIYLPEPALANDLVDAGDELRLQQVSVGLGTPEISEHVATTAFDLHFLVIHNVKTAGSTVDRSDRELFSIQCPLGRCAPFPACAAPPRWAW